MSIPPVKLRFDRLSSTNELWRLAGAEKVQARRAESVKGGERSQSDGVKRGESGKQSE